MSDDPTEGFETKSRIFKDVPEGGWTMLRQAEAERDRANEEARLAHKAMHDMEDKYFALVDKCERERDDREVAEGLVRETYKDNKQLREALKLLAKFAEEQNLLMPLRLQRQINNVIGSERELEDQDGIIDIEDRPY